MFASFARRPIAQQLIVATISAFVIVFAVLILVMQQKAESTAIKGTETNLEHEARLMAGMLDSTYEAVKIRGENESQFFRKYMAASSKRAPAWSGRAMSTCRSSSWATRC